MEQSRIEKYATWLVQNKSKKGTPEFDTVANAYKTLRSEAPSPTPDNSQPDVQNWSEVPGKALSNAPSDAVNVAKGAWDAVSHPIDTLNQVGDLGAGLLVKGAKAVGAEGALAPFSKSSIERAEATADAAGQHIVDNYGSEQAWKNSLSYRPVSTAADVAGVVTGGEALIGRMPTLAKGGAVLAKKTAQINKTKPMYPEVSGDLSKQLKDLDGVDGNRLKEPTEAKLITDKAITNNRVEIKGHVRTLSEKLNKPDPNNPDAAAWAIEAKQALASDAHRAMDNATPKEIEAVRKLVGDTQEGTALVNLLKRNAELFKLRAQPQGGISKYTDVLNPLSEKGGRFGLRGIPGTAIAAFNASTANVPGMIAQAGAVVGGRAIDGLTGRRSLVNKFTKDNKSAPLTQVDPTLESVVKTQADAAEAATKAAEAQRAQVMAERADKEEFKFQYKEAENLNKTITAQQKAVAAAKAKAAMEEKRKQTAEAKEVAREEKAVAKRDYADAVYENKTREKAKAEAKRQADLKAKEAEKAAKAAATPPKQPKAPDTSRAAAILGSFEAKQKQAFLKSLDDKDKAAAKAQAAASAKASPKARGAAIAKEYSGRANTRVNEDGVRVDGDGNPIKYIAGYDKKVREIKKHEAEAEDFANNTSDRKLRKIIDDALKGFQDEVTGKGRKNHENRVKTYEKALEEAETPSQREAVEGLLKPLRDAFEKKD